MNDVLIDASRSSETESLHAEAVALRRADFRFRVGASASSPRWWSSVRLQPPARKVVSAPARVCVGRAPGLTRPTVLPPPRLPASRKAPH